ncbi:MAG: ABC transporter permease [Alphaproteobacteria bacterium]
MIGKDVIRGFLLWRIWLNWAWIDVKQRYRRSVIGPFWSTISLGVSVVGIGGVFSILWNVETHALLPHLATGLILWTFISTSVNEGTAVFAGSAHVIKAINLPMSVHVFRFIARNAILFAHNFIIYIAVFFIFSLPLNTNTLLILPALLLYLLNAVWVVLLLGVVCTRYRDIPQIIQNVMLIFFFVTPIFWFSETLGDAQIIVKLNVFAHFLDLARLPLLGKSPQSETWMVVGAVTLVGWALALPLYERYHRRAASWV